MHHFCGSLNWTKRSGLNFIPSPFDPCLYLYYHDESKGPSGILGVHVDDGLCGRDEHFQAAIRELAANVRRRLQRKWHLKFWNFFWECETTKNPSLCPWAHAGPFNYLVVLRPFALEQLQVTSDRSACAVWKTDWAGKIWGIFSFELPVLTPITIYIYIYSYVRIWMYIHGNQNEEFKPQYDNPLVFWVVYK